MSNLKPLAFVGLLAVCGAANAQVMGGGGGSGWTLFYQSYPYPMTQTGIFYPTCPGNEQTNTGGSEANLTFYFDIHEYIYCRGDSYASPPSWDGLLAGGLFGPTYQPYHASVSIETDPGQTAAADFEMENITEAETWLNDGGSGTPPEAAREYSMWYLIGGDAWIVG